MPANNMRSDFQQIINERGNSVDIIRTSKTLGPSGEVNSTSDTTYTVNCLFQDITAKDRDIHSMGLAEPGNRKVWLKHEYISDDDSNISDSFIPDVNDKIKDHSGTEWRIIEIVTEARFGDNIIFRKAVVRRLE